MRRLHVLPYAPTWEAAHNLDPNQEYISQSALINGQLWDVITYHPAVNERVRDWYNTRLRTPAARLNL